MRNNVRNDRGGYMQSALRMTAQVQPGGKVEVIDAQLPVGSSVEVIVLLPTASIPRRRSLLEVLDEAPGHLAFSSAAEVDAYIRAERDSWER